MTLNQVYEFLHNASQFKHDERLSDAIRTLLQIQRAHKINGARHYTKPERLEAQPKRLAM